jgi:hypothetical protein
MLKIASLIWIMLGTTLAGVAVMIVLIVPDLSKDSMRLIPIAAAAGALLAIPISLLIAKRIQLQTPARR